MSVIGIKVTKDKITIGADTQVTSGQNKDKISKIGKANGIVFGCVGFARDVQLMHLFLQSHKPSSSKEKDLIEFMVEYNEWCRKKDSEHKPYSHFLFVLDSQAIIIKPDFYTTRVKKFDAIGSGEDFVKTALHLGHHVKDAIKVACKLTIYCSEPIEIIEVIK